MSFKDHFSGASDAYRTFRPDYPVAVFLWLASQAPARDCAVDAGTGTGQAALALADFFAQVIALDPSADQIAAAPTHPQVDFRVAPAEATGLPDQCADLLLAAQAVHWFDLDRFYAEAGRLLRPHGLIALLGYGALRLDADAIEAAVQHYYHDVVGPYWPPERRLVEEGYRSLAFPFEELTPPAFEMTQNWTLAQLLGYLGTWSATRRYQQATGEDPRLALRARLAPLWGDPEQARWVSWPLALRVGRNTRIGT